MLIYSLIEFIDICNTFLITVIFIAIENLYFYSVYFGRCLQFNAESTDNTVPLMSYLRFTCHYLECLYDPLSVWRLSLEKFVEFFIYFY